jgi:hypothetical protein
MWIATSRSSMPTWTWRPKIRFAREICWRYWTISC